ncbi:MAG TPA: NBR1-Ig-like domain-containing protein [Myxococcota bacterium]|nr:NBR1-Ig-like domain-containing protein [Myxococcota bacterium]
MLPALLVAVLLGCTPTPVPLPADGGPPPYTAPLTLSPAPPRPGDTLTVTAHLPRRGVQVWFAFSTQGLGPGVCPPELVGACLGIRGQPVVRGPVWSHTGGDASVTVPIPIDAPALQVQAVVIYQGQAWLSDPVDAGLVVQPGASWVSQAIPGSVTAGAAFDVEVTMQNTGTTPWYAGRHRLGSEGPRDNTIWGVSRADLPPNTRVDPGGSATFHLTARAPSQPGAWTMQWGMVEENVGWFGSPSPATPISVTTTLPPRGPAPAGLVRLVDRAVLDESGPFNGLGTTLFWAPWAYRHDRARLEQNLQFIADAGVDYIRVLGSVGSDAPWPADSWDDRPIDPRWPDYDAVIAGLTDLAWDRYGLRVQWTVFGGVDFTPTPTDRTALIDRFIAMSRGREQKIILFETANEPFQNGFSGPGGIAELRALTQRLNDNVDILVGAGAYGEGPELCQVYDGGVADIAIMHYDRTNNFGDGVWRPVRQPWGYWELEGACAPATLPPTAANNEPIGPYASVAEDRDPLRLVMAAAVTWIAGQPLYVLHTGAGVRGGGQADRDRGRPANLWEVENIDATLAGLRNLRARLPGGLASWERHNAHWASYPFATDVTRFVRAYAATRGAEIVAAPIGMIPPVDMTARWDVSLDALDPLTGGAVQSWSLTGGETFRLPAADALILRAPAGAPPTPGGGGPALHDTLQPGESLRPDDPLTSEDGRFSLIYQSDGNLVLYRNGDGSPLWSSGTVGEPAGSTEMQGDGNLVVYAAGGAPVWASGTAGNPGAWLAVQNDANLVVYAPGSVPLWTSGTCCE